MTGTHPVRVSVLGAWLTEHLRDVVNTTGSLLELSQRK